MRVYREFTIQRVVTFPKLRGKHNMRQPYRLGRSSPEHHSLFSRVVNVICAMKRYHILSVSLVCLAGLILGYPNEMYMPLNVQQEINRVTKYSKIENNNDSAPIGYMSCSNNPEDEMTTIEIIRSAGYPAEEHFLTTDDGYILGLHRIPGPPGSTPVLLHHALLESSFCWVISGKERGLAYILADAGYDVWMGNARGNTYSRKHITLDASMPEFWNFSWHEMGIHDLPTEINYITSLKKENLIYIGHSMGTTMFYVMASERPDVATKVKMMLGLAPVAFTSHLAGPFRILGMTIQAIQKYTPLKGTTEFFSQNAAFKFAAKCICNRPILKEICRTFILSTVGFNVAQFNISMLPVILTHTPAGTSMKTIFHFFQGIESKKFLHYDYGEDNKAIYKSKTPPEYDFSKIQVPIALLWAQNDYLAESKDVKRLYDSLPKTIGMYEINDPNYNHLDFLWGKDAPELVYSKILDLMEKYR